MNLSDTTDLMFSSDYKDRFRAEYLQLKIRMIALKNMLNKYKKGTLEFTPSCSYETLHSQLVVMGFYLDILIERAKIEGIQLN
jgi:hypothetical protein